MSDYDLYPEYFDQNNPSPQLMKLWDEAYTDLKARRNRALVWQVPLFIAFWIYFIDASNDFIIITWIVPVVAFGLASQGIIANSNYKPSKDRSSATLRLFHRWSFKSFFEIPLSALTKAKDGFGGLLIAILSIVFLPLWWGFLSFFYSLEFFNNIWWLKDFLRWKQNLLKNAASSQHTHVRGTNILSSVQLSGSPPNTNEEAATRPQPLEAIDGLLTLNPDGGIILGGGVAFDRNSTFSGFSMNGLTMTRESADLLKVSHEGSEKQFRYDGSRWHPV